MSHARAYVLPADCVCVCVCDMSSLSANPQGRRRAIFWGALSGQEQLPPLPAATHRVSPRVTHVALSYLPSGIPQETGQGDGQGLTTIWLSVYMHTQHGVVFLLPYLVPTTAAMCMPAHQQLPRIICHLLCCPLTVSPAVSVSVVADGAVTVGGAAGQGLQAALPKGCQHLQGGVGANGGGPAGAQGEEAPVGLSRLCSGSFCRSITKVHVPTNMSHFL